MKNKQAKFFCENCGSEVPEKSKVCKTCGSFLFLLDAQNVEQQELPLNFKKGCTHCGYANVPYAAAPVSNSKEDIKLSNASFFYNRNKVSSKKSETSLPVWIYAITFVFFIGTLIAVYGCLTSPI